VKCNPGRYTAAFILLFLTKKPSYGFELLKDFQTNLPTNLIDSAAIYRALKSLEKEGFVESHWDTSDSGAAKKYYKITKDGYDELDDFNKDISLRVQNLNYFLDEHKKLERQK
jgi:DNA-binding PadR family transcriptional regulator